MSSRDVRLTTVPVNQSCTPCFFTVNVMAMKESQPITEICKSSLKIHLANARPKELRLPSRSVTLRPKTILPTLACHAELSIRAPYMEHTITPITMLVMGSHQNMIQKKTIKAESIKSAPSLCQNPPYACWIAAIGCGTAPPEADCGGEIVSTTCEDCRGGTLAFVPQLGQKLALGLSLVPQ